MGKKRAAKVGKPLGKINADLQRYEKPTHTRDIYFMQCPRCGTEFSFKEEDLQDRVINCPNCTFEEIFFRSNFQKEN